MKIFLKVVILLGSCLPSVYAMENETALAAIVSYQDQLRSINEFLLKAKQPFEKTLTERILELSPSYELRKKYAVAKYTNQRLSELINFGIPSAKRHHIYPENAKALEAVANVINEYGPCLIENTKSFIEIYESVINQHAEIIKEVFGAPDAQQFINYMLNGIKLQ